MLQRRFKKSLGVLLVGILVSTGASFHSPFKLNQFLAPVNQNHKTTFRLSPMQKKQARNLIDTLDFVISFLEEKEIQQRVHPIKGEPLEDHAIFSGSKTPAFDRTSGRQPTGHSRVPVCNRHRRVWPETHRAKRRLPR